MHLHLLDFPEQVGCEDEVVEGFVVGGDDLEAVFETENAIGEELDVEELDD